MDLRRLAHIVALAEERHFGRAAEKVHLSQPAFSRSIQSAESEVGLPLFDRGPVEATPTAAGLLVLERARRLLFESRCLQRDVNLFREQKLGDIAFGVGPFPAATLLPGLLVALRTRLPAIRTRVMVNNWGVLVEQLRAEELDFFVADIRDVPRDGDLEVRLCGRQTGRLYVRRGHPLLQHQRLTPAQVAPYGLASVRLPVSVQAQMRLALGLEPQDRLPVALECDDIPLLKQVCLESDTVLACSDEALRAEVAAGALVPLDLPDLPTMQSEMGVVSLKGRTHAPVARFAVDFLVSAVLPGGPQHPGP